MKKLILLFFLILSSTLYANSTRDKVGLTLGDMSTTGIHTIKLDNYIVGINYLLNEIDADIKPRFDLEYAKISDNDGIATLYRVSANGIYEFYSGNTFTPYGVLGFGYEVISNDLVDDLENRMFIQGGIGITYHSSHNYNLKIEAKMIEVDTHENQKNEMVVSAGITFPLSRIFSSNMENNSCPPKIEGNDSDRDGIENRLDRCASTPCYFSVNKYGCPEEARLQIIPVAHKKQKFIYSVRKLKSIAKFLKLNKRTNVLLSGHTDNRGEESENIKLSKNMANYIKNKLIDLGISSVRIDTTGIGGKLPIATNSTKSGRSFNRRVEIKLIKKKSNKF